jgi:hypothetical protein
VAMGIELVSAVMKLYPQKFQPGMRLLGNDATAADLAAGRLPPRIAEGWKTGLEEFSRTRAKYLLYD